MTGIACVEFSERMPYPIARAIRDMLAEDDPHFRFRGLIKVFASALKYLSLVAIADYMNDPASEKVNEKLSNLLSCPTLGHWEEFMTAIQAWRELSGRSSPVPELAEVVSGEVARIIKHLIHLRNEYVHADIVAPPDESRMLFDQTLPHVETLLGSLRFLCDYPLLRVSEKDRSAVEAMGSSVLSVEHDDLRIVVRCPERDIDITPFTLLEIDESFCDILVYERLFGVRGKFVRAKFISGNRMRFVMLGDEPDNRVRLLQDVLRRAGVADEFSREVLEEGRLGSAPEDGLVPSMYDLHEKATTYSNAVFDEYKATGRYDPRTYVERKSIRKRYDELMESKANALLVVADSGAGKSTEMCQLSRRYLSNHIVWLLSGRRAHSESALHDILAKLFPPGQRDQRRLAKYFEAFDRHRTTERFIIIFDGLNEAPNPSAAFNDLNELIHRFSYSWLKVVITCRTHEWNVIMRSGPAMARSRFVPPPRGQTAHILKPFDDGEVGLALERYAKTYDKLVPNRWRHPGATRERNLLRSPLLLRFTFEAYRDHVSVPETLEIETLMRRFTDERLRERDRPFIQRYLMNHFFRAETDVLDATDLLDRSERGELDRDEIQLVDHITGEQVVELDQVWRCTDSACANKKVPVLIVFGEDQPRCNLNNCDSFLRQETVDNRATYARLLSENIIAQSDSGDRVLIRLVFDRYFDFLMQRYCFEEWLHQRFDAARFDELLAKADRRSIFVGPVAGVVRRFLERGETSALERVAATRSFAGYHVLRQLFEELAGTNFDSFATVLRNLATRTRFDANVCRAGVHALLGNAAVAGLNRDEVVEMLLLLSCCADERVHDEAGQYLLALQQQGVELITPVIERCAMTMNEAAGLARGFQLVLSARLRMAVRGAAVLFCSAAVFGLGSASDDRQIGSASDNRQVRVAIVRCARELVERVRRHPLLSRFDGALAAWLAPRITKWYREKGALPCNYWEMQFQLESAPDAIRRAADLFFLEYGNLFDLEWREFHARVQSQTNGLLNWYVYAALPAHFRATADADRASAYLRRLVTEGSEVDCYIAGQTAQNLLRFGDSRREQLESVLEAVAERYKRIPSEIFVHLEPVPAGAAGSRAASYVEGLARDANPYAVPWIDVRGRDVHRVYLNAVALYVAANQARSDPNRALDVVLELLERNLRDDLLRFGSDIVACRRSVAFQLIQTLPIAADHGQVQRALECLHRIVDAYITQRRDFDNIDVYRTAIVHALNCIKADHEQDVLGFLRAYDVTRAEFAFLGTVRTMAAEKERLLSRSFLGGNLYHLAFLSGDLREAFGTFTRQAADAKEAGELIHIYTKSFIRWLRDYALPPDAVESTDADASPAVSTNAVRNT